MIKGFRFIVLLFFITVIFIPLKSHAQIETTNREFNPLYKPISVIMRLSYDNFKKIKLMHTSIMNYGGGKEEFDKLVDAFAEASALYFQNKLVESANLFTKNGKDIDGVAAKLAKTYKDETERLHSEIIKMNVKYNIKNSLKGEKPNPTATAAVRGASFGINKANDYYVRSRPIDAITYYRRAKSKCFELYEILEVPLPERFKKDILDNHNKVYISKEKEN
ncbi:MAG: hypothetical protein SVZ03_02210 [Spirochaetota bacterium]|nr:hypothetical protein [Spirochaetota bacterium]